MAIGRDIQANILVTVMLKEMGVKKVVSKAVTNLHGKSPGKGRRRQSSVPPAGHGRPCGPPSFPKTYWTRLTFPPDYSIIELIPPAQLVNKTLGQGNIRGKYGVTVLAIRRGNDVIISPGAEHLVKEGDVLVVVGRNEKLKALEDR